VAVEVPDVGVLALLHAQGERRGVQEGASVTAGKGTDGKVMLGFGKGVVGDETDLRSAESRLGGGLARRWGRV
jgi:hypothetical protein